MLYIRTGLLKSLSVRLKALFSRRQESTEIFGGRVKIKAVFKRTDTGAMKLGWSGEGRDQVGRLSEDFKGEQMWS